MTPVEFHFTTPTGLPIANQAFEVQLSKAGFDAVDSGIIMPRLVFGITDADGKATINLWPSLSLYYVSVFDTESDAALNYKFYVPTLLVGAPTVRLQDIVIATPMSTIPYDEAALLVIHDAKASTLAAYAATVVSQTAAAASLAAITPLEASTVAKAAAAAISETNAAASAAAALASKTAAAGSETSVLASKTSATASETAAGLSATNAAASATTSLAQANIATAKAVLTAADAASTLASKTAAALSETGALASKNAAGASAASALADKSAAALNAGTASNAAATATAAQAGVAASAAAALTSENNAATQAAAALTSKNAAGASAASALADKSAAALSADSALTSANNAELSKTGSDTARDAAIVARTAAETALDSFDDRYLGPKAAAPTLDNDGAALLTGALYWDTALPGMRSWNGAAWVTLPAATAAAISNTPAGGITEATVQAALNGLDTRKADKLLATLSLFAKADTQSVAFTKTAVGTVSIKAGTYVDVAGTLLTYAAATAIVMPALSAGTDYAIYACADGTVRADANFSSPTGYTAADSRKIGGFHYSPGGHLGMSAGGNTLAQINAYSLWDLKFKPSCLDPRGMALVADGFWADIYLLGVDHLTNGSSKYNVTIADGASPPKVSTKFGGNGMIAYTSLGWWEAGEVMAHHGKRLPTYSEFAALAFGTTEASSIGADPVSTTWVAAYIGKWGCAQASGNMWVWGANFGGGTAAAGWAVNTVGRGSTYQVENAALFGGYWGETSNSGSRASAWYSSPTFSGNYIGARGVCDLLVLA